MKVSEKSGADPGFPVGGGANLRVGAKILEKLHEIEKKLGHGGRGGAGAAPQIRHWKLNINYSICSILTLQVTK